MNQRGGIRLVGTVMGRQQHVQLSQLVHWASQICLLVPSKIAQVGKPELPISEDEADAAGILRWVRILAWGGRAKRVLPTCPSQRLRQQFAARGNDLDIEPLQRYAIARLHDRRGALGGGPVPGLLQVVGTLAGLRILSVGDEVDDRKAFRQLGDPANMVAMIMRDQQVVDPLQTCLLRRLDDAVGVARLQTRPTRIHQQRLAGGRHDQRTLPTFHINEVDGHRLGRKKRQSGQQY